MSDTDTQKEFNQDYLADKLHSVGDKLGDAYGEPLLNELITRMERTVAHFNGRLTFFAICVRSTCPYFRVVIEMDLKKVS